MKKTNATKFGAILLASTMLAGSWSSVAMADESEQTIDTATWFSDVSFWTPPTQWDLDENSVTGGITKATGLQFDMNIPAEDGTTKMALMIVSGELPDVISITDTNSIKELTDSDLVWDLDEFLSLYDPDSHLISSGTRLIVMVDGMHMLAIKVQRIPERFILRIVIIMHGVLNMVRTTA